MADTRMGRRQSSRIEYTFQASDSYKKTVWSIKSNLGGLHCSEFINRTVEVYDAAKDSWTNVAVLPTPVYAHGLISLTIEST